MQHWVVVYKNSVWDLLPPVRKKKLKQRFPEIAERLQDVHHKHYQALKELKPLVRSFVPNARFLVREKIHTKTLKKSSLVLTMGGDGTFLYVSHFLNQTPILGINSEPSSSVGHFCSFRFPLEKEKLQNILNQIIQGQDIPKEPLHRLQIQLNEKKIAYPILNDILIAEDNPAATSHFEIWHQGHKKSFKCSGLWVASSWGSSAAFSSAGGKSFPEKNAHGQRQFAYLVREPYISLKPHEKIQWVSEQEELYIFSKMISGRVYLDGMHRKIPFLIGDVLKISFYPTPLWRVLNI